MAKALPRSEFYTTYAEYCDFAREMFFDHAQLLQLQEDALPFLYDDYGHGIQHSKQVAMDACALVMAEARQFGPDDLRQLGLLAQMAALLHDICRLEDNHARRGADTAAIVLKNYDLLEREKAMIIHAVACHDPASPEPASDNPMTQLLSDALYDADVFRWGQDHFSTTLWELCDYEDWTLQEIIDRFPEGLERLRALKSTFRTQVGRTYGPGILDAGEELAGKLFARLKALAVQHTIGDLPPEE